MSTPISEKDLREKKILTTNPIPHNVKGTQKFDAYIKDNKTINLKSGKNTERYPRESSINFRPLDQTLEYYGSRTGSTSNNDDETTSGQMEIANSFEQSILLLGQSFNAITYHRRLNILNTLTDNSIIKSKGNFERTQPGLG